jgi:hypothetical protein
MVHIALTISVTNYRNTWSHLLRRTGYDRTWLHNLVTTRLLLSSTLQVFQALAYHDTTWIVSWLKTPTM